MTTSIAFAVDGDPVPQGSLRTFLQGGKPVITYGRATSLGAWRQAIAARCSQAMIDTPTLAGPVSVSLTFLIRRPRGHYGRSGVAPRFADQRPVVRPDLDKLVRAVLDGMSGVAFRDDAQVVELMAAKQYAERPGLLVELHQLGDDETPRERHEPRLVDWGEMCSCGREACPDLEQARAASTDSGVSSPT